jgi:hypothetical protein
MTIRRAFSGFSFLIVTVAALALPTRTSAALIDYRAVITAQDSGGTTLGYVADDPVYWTPLLTSTSAGALIVDFTLNGTSGSQINLTPENSGEVGYPYFGLVEGRDNTSADIGPGNFNYLYLGNTNGTAPGSTPQFGGNYFSAQTGLSQGSESAAWIIDVNALTLGAAWVNTDSSTPTTSFFVQSNHVYGGGDSTAFHTRFPAPVADVTLHLEILSAIPEATGSVPDFSSTGTLLLLALTAVFGLSRMVHRPA